MDESWNLKKNLAKGISNQFIDNIYQRVKILWSYGGKLLGAGGGGFTLFYIEKKIKEA